MLSRYLALLLLVVGHPVCAAGPTLELTFPVGKSPRVLTTGWLFGARCRVGARDLSDQVQWSGTGTFAPARGRLSRPTFRSPGTNTIILKVKVGRQEVTRKYTLVAVSPEPYACVGDTARCPACAHGCPACPHAVAGPIATGSKTVLVRGKPAARVGDTGRHASCCGPNTFAITGGDPGVLIDGRPAARRGDPTQHCGLNSGRIEDGPGGAAAADGVYVGATTPALCTGTLRLTIAGAQVTGRYAGASPMDKSVTLATTWTGVYAPATGRIAGQVTGAKTTATRSEPLGGTFTAALTPAGLSGAWQMTFQGQALAVPFTLTRQ